MARILIVDDERNMQTVLQLALESGGHEVKVADSAERALKILSRDHNFDAVVSDLKMPGLDGIGLLREMRSSGMAMPYILITAYGTIEKAVEAMKLGAAEVLTKPFAKDFLLQIVGQVARPVAKSEDLVSVSPSMVQVKELLARVGTTSKPVLLMGESGTGKEVAARVLHRHYTGGAFERKPFVWVNCPAVPEHLLESELFGYKKGAFTGAEQDLRGRVEKAEGGTLFFDEIGDLPLAIQPKLLRLLENRTYEPLGTGEAKEAQIRIVCATNRNLRKLVAEGKFREDLFYRINTFTIVLPALRERPQDIPVLATEFLMQVATELRKDLKGFDEEAVALLCRHTWPGNVRELKNIVEHAAVMAQGPVIRPCDFPLDLTAPHSAKPGLGNHASTLETQEWKLIEEALHKNDGNVAAAARTLGVTRNTLRYRLAKYGG